MESDLLVSYFMCFCISLGRSFLKGTPIFFLMLLLTHIIFFRQVDKIPYEFDSVNHYFKSFIAPLVEETRSQLGISLEAIHKAPYSKIISMEAVGGSKLLCKMDVDIGYMSDNYVVRSGDILILSSLKPEVIEDLRHDDTTFVMVIPSDVQHQRELRIKALRDAITEQNRTKFKYAVFATNIMTNLRMWNAICSQKGMDGNFTLIKSLLSPKNMVRMFAFNIYFGWHSTSICWMQAFDFLSDDYCRMAIAVDSVLCKWETQFHM